MGQRGADHAGLFGDLLGHEMLVPALVDRPRRSGRCGSRDWPGCGWVEDFDRLRAGDDRDVALFEIGDAVGQGGERDGIGADEHLALAVADGQRRALAGGDQQVILAVEQEAERIGAVELRDGLERRVAGRKPAIHMVLGQQCHGFGVGFGGEVDALSGQFLAHARGNFR